MKSPIVKVNRRSIYVRFTHEQARQLFSVVNGANQSRDHEDWIRSAGATPGQVRALRDVMGIAGEMKDAAR